MQKRPTHTPREQDCILKQFPEDFLVILKGFWDPKIVWKEGIFKELGMKNVIFAICIFGIIVSTMSPEMIKEIIRKRFTDVRAIGKFIPRQLMCVIGASTESTLCLNYTI